MFSITRLVLVVMEVVAADVAVEDMVEAVAAEEEVEADTTMTDTIPASTGTTSPTLKGSSAAA